MTSLSRPDCFRFFTHPDYSSAATYYTYNPDNSLSTETVSIGSTNVFTASYTYYHNGLRQSDTEIHDYAGSITQLTYTWTYFDSGELASETLAASGAGAPASYADSFTYDLDGNRLSKTHTSIGPTETTTSTYNHDDQLTQTVDNISGTANFTYDANGN